MKKLAFVFKGSVKSGFGHIARTLYISKNLQNIDCFYYFCGDHSLLSDFPQERISFFKDETELIMGLSAQSFEWVVFDRQKNPADTIQTIRNNKVKTLIIEDNEIGADNTDILWDANIFKTSETDNFYTGCENYILNPDIEKYFKKNISQKTNTLFLCLGGTDVKKNIPFLIENLRDRYFLYILPGIRYNDYLKYNGLNVKILSSSSLYYNYALKSDIAVVSGGITMYEVVSMNIPTFVWPQVEHQNKNAEQLLERDIIKKADNDNNIINKIIDFAENYKERQNLFINMKKTELGHGFKKIKKILEET